MGQVFFLIGNCGWFFFLRRWGSFFFTELGIGFFLIENSSVVVLFFFFLNKVRWFFLGEGGNCGEFLFFHCFVINSF